MPDEDPVAVEVVTPQADSNEESVSNPAELIRIGTMVQALRDEVRAMPLDEPGRRRLTEIYARAVDSVKALLSEELREELSEFALPIGDGATPTTSELRVAQAQLAGWLEGLFRGIQAAVFTQQMAAQRQMEGLRHRARPELPQQYL